MKMARWIKLHSMTKAQAAAFFGVTRPTMTDWVSGRRKPSPRKMEIVASRTDGDVMPNDWMRVRVRKPLADDSE
jgi:DNA-binding transcriptional regulator YdaS (Cro superfamily)